jgi:XTP/dITP diphosphohydrolase
MRFHLATGNAHKIDEIAFILGDEIELVGTPPDVEETEDTFEGNALLKARAVVAATGEPALADDSGIVVDALDGAPGVRSQRWGGDDPVGRMLAAMEGVEDRAARFVCAAVAVFPDGREVVAEGRVEGSIGFEARGSGGFGYDPVFIPNESDGRTFGEMAEPEKHEISHRGRAFRALAALLPPFGGA